MDLFKIVGKIAVDNSEANKALADTTSQAKRTAEGMNDAGSSAESSGGKFSAAMGKIGSAAVKIGKVAAVGIGVAATAISGIVAKSVSAYADYEQLVGGVETLFKGSADEVLKYAENAYKTAGMSANAYMETVTSFSASLLQSLDGDTAKAAQKADMAITDMADNAGKMGSDIETLKTAYAGFAKGQFMLLDNLKLGYGGTQEEMKRLLSDAEAISGVKYDISSYADIVDAIHVVQTEMGITGTTAKEAASTISGSIASMKASWANLLTAIADENADFGSYVNNFVDSVTTVAGNLLPRIEVALGGVVQLIDKLAPVLIAKIPGLLSSVLPGLINAAVSLINSVVSVLPALIDMLVNSAIPKLLSGIVEITNSLISALPGLVESIASALPVLLPLLVNSIASIIVTLCNNFTKILQPIFDNLPAVVISILEALKENAPAIIQGLITLCVSIAEALPSVIVSICDAIPSIVSLLVEIILGNLPTIIWGLCQVALGIVKALPYIFGSLIMAVAKTFEGIWDGLKKVFAPVGDWMNENVVQPVVEWFQEMWAKVKEVWDGICNAVSVAVKFIGAILDAAWQIITLPWRFIWENCKEYVFAAWNWIKEKVSAAINAVRSVIESVMTSIRNFLSPILNAIRDTFSKVWNGIKEKVSSAVNSVKNTVSNVFTAVKNKVASIFDGIKSKISNTVNNIKTTVSNVFNKVKESMEKPIQKAKDTIAGIVDKIKGFFSGLKLKFPNIKLPHFGITPAGWKIGDLLKGSIPKLNIDWYAKAMNNPMIMTEPTVFGYDSSTGNLMGGGEAGSEVVTGTNTLLAMIGQVVAANSSAQSERVLAILTAILEALVGGNADILQALMSGHTLKVGEREFARLVKEYA